MKTTGTHLLVEYHGCNKERLDDKEFLEQLFEDAAKATGANVVATVFHRYSPQGVSGVVVIEESHLSLHTWPEYGYAAVDIYTCGDCDPYKANPVLMAGLGAGKAEIMRADRGQDGGMFGIRVVEHQIIHNY